MKDARQNPLAKCDRSAAARRRGHSGQGLRRIAGCARQPRKANQQVAQAKFNAAGQIAGAALMQGAENMNTKGKKMAGDGMGPPQEVSGTFFRPVNPQGQQVTGFKNRLGFSGFFGG